MQSSIDSVAKLLSNAKRVTVLTGAGVSKESGIPTFRDAQTGFWENYRPEDLATPEGFLNDPKLVWTWYDYRRKMLNDVSPNPGHDAIVQLEKLIDRVTVVTQNVDGLHQRAGSSDVLELHGSIKRFHCFDNQHEARDVPFDLQEPPECAVCGSMVRPAVVWFGEALPADQLRRGIAECEQSEVILVVGTSSLVQPAASLPISGYQRGAKIVEVNPDATPMSRMAEVVLQGPSGEVLPKVVARLIDIKSSGV